MYCRESEDITKNFCFSTLKEKFTKKNLFHPKILNKKPAIQKKPLHFKDKKHFTFFPFERKTFIRPK